MQITNEIKENILNSIDIVEIISETVDLKKRGNNFIGLCPFHNEKTPSFTVSQDKGIYKCFGCGKSGNVISFLMDSHGYSYIEAVKYLAQKANIIIPEKEYSPKEKEQLSKNELIQQVLSCANEYYRKMLNTTAGRIAFQFFIKRGFSPEIINEFQLGYSPDSWDATLKELQKNKFEISVIKEAGLSVSKDDGSYYDRFRGRAMFPIQNNIGKVIAFGARQLNNEDTQAKYINSPQTIVYDKSRSLYGLYQAKNQIRNKKTVILVEGYADVITLHQAGFKHSVASSGTALTREQLEILSKMANILYLAYDSDEAGIKATERAIEIAIELGFDLRIVRLPEGEDPDSLIHNHNANLFNTYLNSAVNFLDFKIELLKKKQDLTSPYSKASAVREMLQLIGKIPDRLQHDDYISHLANLLNLSNIQIRKVYEEKDFQERNTHYKKEKEKINFKDDNQHQSYTKESPKSQNIHILKEETELIHIALTSHKGIKAMLDQFSVTSEKFITNDGKRLFSIIVDSYLRNNSKIESIIENEEVSPIDKDLLTRLAFVDDIHTNDSPSELWNKYGNDLPEKNIIRIIKDSIYKLELHSIDSKIADCRDSIQSNNLDYSVLKEFKMLNKKKMELIANFSKEHNHDIQ